MKIRKAKKEDLEKCAKLLKVPSFAFASGDFPDINYLKDYLKSDLFFVSEVNSEIIGCIYGEKLKSKIVLVWYFVVKKKFRGKGIGKKLLSRFESQCKKEKIKWILLYAFSKNKKSLNFYEKNGYNQGKKYIEFNKKLK